MIRVLICDGHALFRRGLRLVLESDDGIEVVAEAGDGPEALQCATETTPDVVVIDVHMPSGSGIEVVHGIRAAVPEARIVVLTGSDAEADLFGAIRAGACAYLLKEISIDEIAPAVRAVMADQSLLSPSMTTKLLAEFNVLSARAHDRSSSTTPRLTDRELEVLGLVARSLTNREVAAELFISENTVKNHVRNILEKLQLHSRMEAVMFAVRERLIELDET